MDKKKTDKIYKLLEAEYPEATTSLDHKDPLQLLVATILSAQCTDKRVNIVTKSLFRKYKKAGDYAGADLSVFENDIRSTGFYKNKAKNIVAAAGIIKDEFKCKVPDSMESLIKLPGVARKTANIVLYHAYGKNCGIAVDTHVKRLTGRLGITLHTDPVKIEKDMMRLFDRKKWGDISVLLIEHGRNICDARKPLCHDCVLKKNCPSFDKFTSLIKKKR